MAPKPKKLTHSNVGNETTARIDPPALEETVITLATSADRQRLRNELLRLIIRSESRRKRATHTLAVQDAVTTEGSANLPIEAAEA